MRLFRSLSADPTLKTTVAIPLFRSASWLPNIVENVTRLLPVARILLSDVTEDDDSLATLKQQFEGHRNIEWVGRRSLDSGWVAHCNDLKLRAKSPYFMWLPHDDLVEAEWVRTGEDVLERNRSAALAVGDLRLLTDSDGTEQTLEPSPDNEIEDPVERVSKALVRQFITKEPGLGHAFRGVQRQKMTPLLSDAISRDLGFTNGWKTDVFWAIECLSIGTFAVTQAKYFKRLHDASASAPWELENSVPGFRAGVARSLSHLTKDQRLEVLARIWDDEAIHFREIHQRQRNKITELGEKVVRFRTKNNKLRARLGVEES